MGHSGPPLPPALMRIGSTGVLWGQMSGQSADLVREAYRAASERDLDRGMASFDQGVELDVSAINPDQGIYRGLEGIRRYFEEVWEISEEFAFEVEEAVEVGGGERVIVTLRARMVGAASGAEVIQTFGAVWRIVDDKVTEISIYPGPAEARRAVGI